MEYLRIHEKYPYRHDTCNVYWIISFFALVLASHHIKDPTNQQKLMYTAS